MILRVTATADRYAPTHPNPGAYQPPDRCEAIGV